MYISRPFRTIFPEMKHLELSGKNANNARCSKPTCQEALSERIDKWVKAKGYCEAGITTYILAERVCSTRRTITRYFNEHRGEAFRTFINRLRVEEAKRQLLNSTDNIEQIATNLGYTRAHFQNTFKALEGISPAQWRKAHTPK